MTQFSVGNVHALLPLDSVFQGGIVVVNVLGLGDNVCDVYLHTETMYPGGQALNFAVYAAQLGARADYMGVFGQDEVAAHVQHTLDEKGIGRSHCRSWLGENGFARVALVDGDRVFKGSNRGGVLQEHPITLEEEDMPYLSTFQLIHTTNNGFIDGLLPVLRKLPVLVSYDFSYRWNEEDRVARVCPYVDFAFLSCSDLDDEATERLCRSLNVQGCGTVVATRGSRGATVFDGTRIYRQYPKMVEPVDTMGAGDSFATAMLVSLLEDMEPEGKKRWSDPMVRAEVLPKALEKAAAFSAETCLVHGAFGCGIPIPPSARDRLLREM